LPWQNKPKDPYEQIGLSRNYDLIIMGVDWGGGGEDEVSFTTVAILGWRASGQIDVIFGERLLTPHDQLGEANRILNLFNAFGCHFMAHDYNGAGSGRETIMVQAGMPAERIIPIVYYRSAAANMMVHKPGVEQHPRAYWQLDKARSLVTLCQAIKLGVIRFFAYDHKGDEDRGLLHDLLALVENKVETARGPDIYTVQRNPMLTDDFAHSVNFAACSIWHRMQAWPDLASLAGIQMSLSQMQAMYPEADYYGYLGTP
jgi:hypothetical protein